MFSTKTDPPPSSLYCVRASIVNNRMRSTEFNLALVKIGNQCALTCAPPSRSSLPIHVNSSATTHIERFLASFSDSEQTTTTTFWFCSSRAMTIRLKRKGSRASISAAERNAVSDKQASGATRQGSCARGDALGTWLKTLSQS